MAANGIGARLPRKEDARHLKGEGTFVGDIDFPNLLEAAFLRSPLAHAKIAKVTLPIELEGRAFTSAQIATSTKPIRTPSALPGYKSSDYPLLATKKVRFVGEPIAVCVAQTRAEAEDMCRQIVIEFEELPAIVDAVDGRKPGSPLVHEEFGDNLFVTTSANIRFDDAVKGADVVVNREFRLARNCMSPLEGKGALAYLDERAEHLVVYSSTQVPHIIRSAISESLGLEERRIRVIAPDVGGGFGYKSVLQVEELCIAWLGLTLQKPVRWTEDRYEHLVAAANAREHHYQVSAYANKSGKLLALDVELTVDCGAYSAWPVSACLEAIHAARNLPSNYTMDGFRCSTYSVTTNKPPIVPYRSVAKPSLGVAVEVTLDAVARELGLEPAEIRLINLIPADQMPYNTITGVHYDSGNYPRSMQTAIEQIKLDQIRDRQKTKEPDGRLIGVGFSNYTETTAMGTKVFIGLGWPLKPGFEQATVRLTTDGDLEIKVGVLSPGVGLETTLAQVACEILGIDPARTKVVHGDTALTPYSTGTYNSRGMVMAGGAVSMACKELAARIRHIGAHLLQERRDSVTLKNGAVIGARGGVVPIQQVAKAWYIDPENLPADVNPSGLEVTTGYKPSTDTGAIGYGTHAAVVAVDPEIGTVEILDYVIVEDCGTIVNPLIVEGQAYGATTQGIGQALYEEMRYDELGQPLASTLSDYLLPGASEVPNIRVIHFETPSPYTEMGIKGVGEAGSIGAPGAILNAINDALRPLCAEICETPATPRVVLNAILNAGRSQAGKLA